MDDEIPKTIEALNQLRAAGTMTSHEWSIIDRDMQKVLMQTATSLLSKGDARNRRRYVAKVQSGQIAR
jgi:hypothetical protein